MVLRRSDHVVAALVVTSLLVACTPTEGGRPVASGGSPPSASQVPTTGGPTGAPSESRLPPRPRDIDIVGLDPCTLWTPDQLTALELESKPVGGGPTTTATGDRACSYPAAGEGRPLVDFFVAFELDRDASDLLIPDSQGVTTQVAEVAGFPAVREAGPEQSGRPCMFAVSTKDGQFVEVRLDYASGLSSGVLPLEQACERTLQAATFAMQTLQAQR